MNGDIEAQGYKTVQVSVSSKEKKVPQDLKWSHVNFSVANGSKKILTDCWGEVPAGKVCAIMGPSGAGKVVEISAFFPYAKDSFFFFFLSFVVISA